MRAQHRHNISSRPKMMSHLNFSGWFCLWVGFGVHKCSAKISGLCFSCFSLVCRQHGVRFSPQEAFLAASNLACAHTVGFGSVISPDKLMVSVHPVDPVSVIWFVLRSSVPMLWFCLICLTVSFWSLLRSIHRRDVMLGWFPSPVYLFRKWCLFLIRGRFTYSYVIYCVIPVHDVSTAQHCFGIRVLMCLKDGVTKSLIWQISFVINCLYRIQNWNCNNAFQSVGLRKLFVLSLTWFLNE